MKIVLEFDDTHEGDMREYELVKQTRNMWGFINSFKSQVEEWYKYPDDNEPLTADTLKQKMFDWFVENGLKPDEF